VQGSRTFESPGWGLRDDGAAVDDDDLACRETGLHEVEIGLGDVLGFADSTYGKLRR
jgi:hypothetical protein